MMRQFEAIRMGSRVALVRIDTSAYTFWGFNRLLRWLS